jgi:aerobic-type carbon monoxide dehydrogenase small subunit (CoxS/CutS family)
MATFTLTVNGKSKTVEVPPGTPLLWVLRENLSLTGTKYACGMALCGSCTVHLDGEAVRSCVIPIQEADGKRITTIEGLSSGGDHPLQKSFIAENALQCGYCMSGQIMAAAALLNSKPRPTDDDINEAMNGNLCRCGSYQRIRRAIHRAAGEAMP